MNPERTPLSAVILCDRFADETAIEPWTGRPEGRKALDHLTTVVRELTGDLVLVTRDPLSVFDWGGLAAAPHGAAPTRLAALHTGLTLAGHAQALVLALDMPWIDAAVIGLLQAAFQSRWDAIAPEVTGRSLPFPAIYAKSALPRITLHLERRVLNMPALLEKLRVRPVSEKKLRKADPQMRTLENLPA